MINSIIHVHFFFPPDLSEISTHNISLCLPVFLGSSALGLLEGSKHANFPLTSNAEEEGVISLEVPGKLLFTNFICPFAGDKGREFNIPHLPFLCPILTHAGRMRQIVFICCSAPTLPRGAVLAPAQNACCLPSRKESSCRI